jgi:hypothetical protein
MPAKAAPAPLETQTAEAQLEEAMEEQEEELPFDEAAAEQS